MRVKRASLKYFPIKLLISNFDFFKKRITIRITIQMKAKMSYSDTDSCIFLQKNIRSRTRSLKVSYIDQIKKKLNYFWWKDRRTVRSFGIWFVYLCMLSQFVCMLSQFVCMLSSSIDIKAMHLFTRVLSEYSNYSMVIQFVDISDYIKQSL